MVFTCLRKALLQWKRNVHERHHKIRSAVLFSAGAQFASGEWQGIALAAATREGTTESFSPLCLHEILWSNRTHGLSCKGGKHSGPSLWPHSVKMVAFYANLKEKPDFMLEVSGNSNRHPPPPRTTQKFARIAYVVQKLS
jgi:hypothetical protein